MRGLRHSSFMKILFLSLLLGFSVPVIAHNDANDANDASNIQNTSRIPKNVFIRNNWDEFYELNYDAQISF